MTIAMISKFNYIHLFLPIPLKGEKEKYICLYSLSSARIFFWELFHFLAINSFFGLNGEKKQEEKEELNNFILKVFP